MTYKGAIVMMWAAFLTACSGGFSGAATEPAQQQVSFLSDRDPVYSYLETIQCYAYARNPEIKRLSGDPKEIQTMVQVAAPILGSTADARADAQRLLTQVLPTRYEDPVAWRILSDASTLVDTYLKKRSQHWIAPKLGTLPSGDLNARSLSFAAANESLVVMNSAIFSFAYELTKLGVDTIPVTEQGNTLDFDFGEQSLRNLAHDPVFMTRFSMALEDFSRGRKVHGHASPQRIYRKLMVDMTIAMEVFVLAHEYGHIYLGHTGGGGSELRVDGVASLDTIAPKARELHPVWEHEVSADIFGYVVLEDLILEDRSLCRTTAEGYNLRDYCLMAPILFFDLAAIAREARFIYEHHVAPPEPDKDERQRVTRRFARALAMESDPAPEGAPAVERLDESTSTSASEQDVHQDHPPDWARAGALRARYKSLLQRDDNADARMMANFAIAIDDHLGKLWMEMKPIWLEIVAKPYVSRAGSDTALPSPSMSAHCRNPYRESHRQP